jgi:hypothetical protein
MGTLHGDRDFLFRYARRDLYRNHNECPAGNLINVHDLAPDTGPFENLCPSCAQLNRAQIAQEESSGCAEEY